MIATCERKTSRRKVNTRDAVEAAIEMAKGDRTKSWEGQARGSRRIAQWAKLPGDGKSDRSDRNP